MMQPKTLRNINLLIFLLAALSVGFGAYLWLSPEPLCLATAPVKKPPNLPFSFRAKEPSDTLGPPFIHIEKKSLPLRLPDLRNTLIYHGSNHRPDTSDVQSAVNIGMRGTQSSVTVSKKTPIYLQYDSSKPLSSRWSFSSENKPTSVWIEIEPQEAVTDVSVFLKAENGEIIQAPNDHAHFSLAQTNAPSMTRSNTTWEIAGLRVDSSLLIRQRAIWLGQDLFLQECGGKEFEDIAYKERIDFLDPEAPYFCHVGTGSCLIWSDGRWHEATPGPETRSKPLLVAKKITDRTISFDLWDAEGKNRVSIELHRVISPIAFKANVDIKFIGARSKKEWIISVAGSRMLVRDDDWLFATQGQWKKITTAEELDSIVNGKIKGQLLVLQGTETLEHNLSLIGTLFDESRTKKTAIKIPLFKSLDASPKSPHKQSQVKNSAPIDEDDDDDDDDDDDFLDEDDDDDDDDFDDDDEVE